MRHALTDTLRHPERNILHRRCALPAGNGPGAYGSISAALPLNHERQGRRGQGHRPVQVLRLRAICRPQGAEARHRRDERLLDFDAPGGVCVCVLQTCTRGCSVLTRSVQLGHEPGRSLTLLGSLTSTCERADTCAHQAADTTALQIRCGEAQNNLTPKPDAGAEHEQHAQHASAAKEDDKQVPRCNVYALAPLPPLLSGATLALWRRGMHQNLECLCRLACVSWHTRSASRGMFPLVTLFFYSTSHSLSRQVHSSTSHCRAHKIHPDSARTDWRGKRRRKWTRRTRPCSWADSTPTSRTLS